MSFPWPGNDEYPNLKLAGVSDPTKKSQAYGHLKTAYQDELASNFTGCLDELKGAEALMQ